MDPTPPQPAYAIAIICFGPEPEALTALCRRLAQDNARRVLINNDSGTPETLRALAQETGFELLDQGENLGIAKAVNNWVASLPESIAAFALFDQDSLPDSAYVATLFERLRDARDRGEPVVAIGGQVLDAPEDLPLKFVRLGRLRVHTLDATRKDVNPDYLIISGTVFDRVAFELSGGFDTDLFVDNVDVEWSYRMLRSGARLIGTQAATLRHRIGDECLTVPGLRRGLKVHSAPRLRLMSRSRVMSYRKASLPLRWKYHDGLRFAAKTALLLALHRDRLPMGRAIAAGIGDGLRTELSQAPRGLPRTNTADEAEEHTLGARLRRRLKRALPGRALNKARNALMGLHKLRHTRARKVALFDFLRDGKALSLAPADTPLVSIVLVLYNRAELTLACMRSLSEHMDHPFEVIVIDNASEDETTLLLDHLEGATIVRNKDNVGFLRACNQAAELARGTYLLLLNNDSELGSEGIGAAVDTLRGSESIGAVGAKIVLLDGRLQEAGSIIWSDGSCLGYGRDMDPTDPRANFERDVDYCSGAFLLTPRALFRAMGGFDETFAPAYYEETDYCARLWREGYRVVYQPRTQITHFEFASSSTGSTAAMEQMARNAITFRAKHADYLQTRLAPAPANVLRARHQRHDARRVLYIDDRIPHQYQGSGFPRSNDVVNVLADTGALVTVMPYNFPYEDDDRAARTDIPSSAEIMCGYGRHNIAEFLQEREGFFDAVWISRPHNMLHFRDYVDLPALAGAAIIYDAEAFFAWRDIRKAEVRGRPLSDDEREALLRSEADLLRHADHVVTVSDAESEGFVTYGDISADDITVVGHALRAAREAPGFAARHDFLFVGNLDYCDAPNSDSVLWFVREVWPLVRAELPEAALHVVGSHHCDAIRTLTAPGLTLHGRVEDLSTLYDRSRVFIAPTRFAAGIPYKIHDATAAGVPVVASDLVAHQVGWKDSDALLNAAVDDPAAFARACLRLHGDQTLWTSTQASARRRLMEECDPQHFAREVETALERGLAKCARRSELAGAA